MEHPLDIINELLKSGYYNNLPPFTYEKDAASACYSLGFCSKTDYNIAKARYEWANSKKYIKSLIVL